VTFRRDDQNAAKPTFYDSIQLIQSHLYATTGFIQTFRALEKGEAFGRQPQALFYMLLRAR
jgi:hypothetical protein